MMKPQISKVFKLMATRFKGISAQGHMVQEHVVQGTSPICKDLVVFGST